MTMYKQSNKQSNKQWRIIVKIRDRRVRRVRRIVAGTKCDAQLLVEALQIETEASADASHRVARAFWGGCPNSPKGAT